MIVVNPLTLRGLLAAEGAIDAGGVALDAENVLQYTLLEQYRLARLQDADQTARRDQLGAVARAAIDAFETRPWEPPSWWTSSRRREEAAMSSPAITWRSGDQKWVDDHAERAEW